MQRTADICGKYRKRLVGHQVVGVHSPHTIDPAELIPTRGPLRGLAEHGVELSEQCAVERIVRHHDKRSRTIVGRQFEEGLAGAGGPGGERLDAGSEIDTAVFAFDLVT